MLLRNARLIAGSSDLSLHVFNGHLGFGDANGFTAAAPSLLLSTGAAVAVILIDFSTRLIATTKTGRCAGLLSRQLPLLYPDLRLE